MEDTSIEGMSSSYIKRINHEKFSTIIKRKETVENKIRKHFRMESK